MTTTAYTVTPVPHDDPTVRTLTLANGTTMTVADDPDTTANYCLSCEDMTTPACPVIVYNREEWDHVDGAAGASFCPECMGTLLCEDWEADRILREMAEDDATEVRFQEWRDGERVSRW